MKIASKEFVVTKMTELMITPKKHFSQNFLTDYEVVKDAVDALNVEEKITNAILISTNGSSVPRETLDYIKELSKDRKVIILTDPDYPGLRIRNILNKEIPNAYNAFVPRDKASNGKKLGVAETSVEEIKKALEEAQVFNVNKEKQTISLEELYELGLVGRDNSSYLREKVYSHFKLGYGNAKVLMKRLSSMGLNKEDVEKYLKEIEK